MDVNAGLLFKRMGRLALRNRRTSVLPSAAFTASLMYILRDVRVPAHLSAFAFN